MKQTFFLLYYILNVILTTFPLLFKKLPSSRYSIAVINYFFPLIYFVSGTQTSTAYQQADNYLEEDKYLPGFLTLGQKYSIALGSTVILPCKINETGE